MVNGGPCRSHLILNNRYISWGCVCFPLWPDSRTGVVQALEDLIEAVGEVKALQERHAEAGRSAEVEVSVQVRKEHRSLHR